jgi:Dolichyl-phosphate-mannose-protein mannosyltransferase
MLAVNSPGKLPTLNFSKLIAWIELHPVRALTVFATLHFAVWTALPTILYANLPLDVIEGLNYGREWQLGYDKLPPLPWWLLEIAHVVWGRDVAYYMLAEIAVVSTLVLVFATALPLVGPVGAIVATIIIDGLHYLNFSSVKFNHNVIELPFWALVGFSFCASLRSSRTVDSVLLGVALGFAFWAKYFVIVLALPLALFFILDREARPMLATPGPWIALTVALVVAAPHIAWLIAHDFLPFQYVDARAAPSRGLLDHLFHPLQAIALQLIALLPALVIGSPLAWPPRIAALNARPNYLSYRAVTLLAFGPIATLALLSLVTGKGTIASWGFPVWIFFGAWFVIKSEAVIKTVQLIWVVTLWTVVSTIFVIAFIADYTILPYLDHRYRAALFPGEELAAELTQRFHAATGEPLRYVIGTMWDGGNVAYYSPDQPKVLIDGLARRAPWIDLNDLRAKGALVVWTVGDLEHLPAAFVAIAPSAEVKPPFTLPMRRAGGEVHVGWAILKP